MAFVLWLGSLFLWFLVSWLAANHMVPLALKLAGVCLGSAVGVLYMPITRRKWEINPFRLSVMALDVSLALALGLAGEAFPYVGEWLRAGVVVLVFAGASWALAFLLRPYREETTYPTFDDDWFARPIREH
jgi:hypothetical protein